MSDQVQCPNCGGFKVTTKDKDRIDLTTNRRYGSGNLPILDFSDSNACAFAIFLFPLWLALLIISLPIHLWSESRVPKDVIWEYSYVCNLCGYEWKWRENEPLPQVNVQPDLIAKGGQKLQEDAERERKEQEFRDAGMWMKK